MEILFLSQAAIAFIALGVFFIVKDIRAVDKRKNLEERCQSRAVGKLVDNEKEYFITLNGKRPRYYHVYEYKVGNRIYRQRSSYGYNLGEGENIEELLRKGIGLETDIFYNMDKPEEFYVPIEPDGERTLNSSIIIGGTCIIVGIGIFCLILLVL